MSSSRSNIAIDRASTSGIPSIQGVENILISRSPCYRKRNEKDTKAGIQFLAMPARPGWPLTRYRIAAFPWHSYRRGINRQPHTVPAFGEPAAHGVRHRPAADPVQPGQSPAPGHTLWPGVAISEALVPQWSKVAEKASFRALAPAHRPLLGPGLRPARRPTPCTHPPGMQNERIGHQIKHQKNQLYLWKWISVHSVHTMHKCHHNHMAAHVETVSLHWTS